MNNKTDIDVQYVSPLKKICMTIGELPASYLETMSYYEMLVWFTEFLKNKVIPAVNNNAEAVSELQALYEELRIYVNDYFDNLDIAEEVDNKLEEMAESGQLTDIIAQYLGLAGMIAFDTVADMKLAENLVNGSKCHTLGYSTINDNGSAIYIVRTVTNEDVIDECSIIALYDPTLVAELITTDVNIKQFGVTGDGTTDDYTNFNKALSYCSANNKILITNENETYKINNEIEINCTIKSYGTIDGDVKFGFMRDKIQFINGVTGTLTLTGTRNTFNINYAENILILGVSSTVGFFWNKINIEHCQSLTLDSKNNGAINENIITGGNCSGLLLTTSEGTGGEINNNSFINCDFSYSGVVQNDDKGKTNTLISCYIEGENTQINGNFNHISPCYQNIPSGNISNSSLLNSNAFLNNSKDYLSAGLANLAEGGSWEKLKANGTPVCYDCNPAGTSVQIIEDLTNPDGSGLAIEQTWLSGRTWMYYRANINKYLPYGGSMCLLLKGYELSTTMIFKDDTGDHYIKGSKTPLNDGWYLYRWNIHNSTGLVKYGQIYVTQNTAFSQDEITKFGGCFVSPYKTGFLPFYNPATIRASLTSAPTNGIWNVGDIVINSTGSSIGWICTASPHTFTSIGQ